MHTRPARSAPDALCAGEWHRDWYAPGSSVLVEELPGGELRIMSTEKVRECIRDIGGRVVSEHGEALQILANHDPDAPQQ